MDFLLFNVKFSVAILLFTVLFAVLLRRETFYTLNRFFILFSVFFCLTFSFISFDGSWLPGGGFDSFRLARNFIPAIYDARGGQHIKPADGLSYRPASSAGLGAVLETIYLSGLCIFSGRFILQGLSLYRITRRSKKTKIHGEDVYDMTFSSAEPFSFLKRIYLDTRQLSENDAEKILAHESVHTRQLHTLDIMFMELLLVIFWYNPFCWFLKKYTVQNLEFLADKTAAAACGKKEYQFALLRTSVPASRLSLISNFNFNDLKTRIAMLNKKNSDRVMIGKYYAASVLLLAAVFSICASFSGANLNSTVQSKTTTGQIQRREFKKRIRETVSALIDKNINLVLSHEKNGNDKLKLMNRKNIKKPDQNGK